MKKIGKSVFALFLAGVMAFTAVGELHVEAKGTEAIDIIMENLAEEERETIAENVEIPAETEAEIVLETETESETEIQTESEIESEIQTETEMETESETQTETEMETESEIQTETEMETESETQTETEMETESEIQTETEMETESEIQTETEIEVETETELEAETEMSGFSGLSDYTLSSSQMESRRALSEFLPQIEGLTEGQDYKAGEVVFLADSQEEAEKIAAAYNAELKGWAYGVGLITLPKEVSVMDALGAAASSATTASDDAVVLPPVWPNYTYTSSDDVVDEQYIDANSYRAASSNFSDPFLDPTNSKYQWQHAMVGSVYAWNAGYTGKGVTVAVLDTGVFDGHDDLQSGIVHYDFTTDADKIDGDGHGTHVAGLVAAKSGNGIGGAGIAPDATILDLKVLNKDGEGTLTPSGDSYSVLQGMNALVQGKTWTVAKADVVNMSLGGSGYDGNANTVMQNLYKDGTAVFVAAGNDGSKTKAYPAAYQGAICVGAVQQDRGRAYFSNYGSWVKFSAPGSGLYSTYKDGSYAIMSGTSQATPIVSGIAAVILSADSDIQFKSGKDRVDALIKKMNSGVVKGSNGAAGIVSLPKALNLSTMVTAPKAPVFAEKSKTVNEKEFTVKITPVSVTDVVYYSVDGKNPTYKNGTLSNNAIRYTGEFTVSGKSKVVVKAIAINACGKVSKVASATYTLKPKVEKITIDGQDKLVKGGKATLTASIYPDYAANKKLEWKSSDQNAVSVSNGKVTAKAGAEAGKTYTITATAKDGSNVKDEFKITITDQAKVKAVSFKDENNKVVKTAKATILKDQETVVYDAKSILKVDLSAGGTGTENDVNWKTDNARLATVDAQGQITASNVGKVKITAIANDGSGKSASFILDVTKEIDTIMIIGPDQISNGKSVQMGVSYSPYNAAYQDVVWSCDKAGVTVNNKGKVSVSASAAPGKYEIEVTVKGGASAKKEITVVDNAIQSIKLDAKTITIFRTGGTYDSPTTATIAATATGKQGASTTYEFTSSNPNVARVDRNTGVVTATGRTTGSTKITCKATDGSGKSASCTVKVVNPTSKMSLSSSLQWIFGEEAMSALGTDTIGYVARGKKLKLTANFEEEYGSVSNKKVKWTSSNENIATVANGVVTVKNGAEVSGKGVIITAEALDGSNAKATYVVEVQDPIKSLKMYSNVRNIITGATGFEEWDNGTFLTPGGTAYAYIEYNGAFCDRYGMLPENISYDNIAVEVSNSDLVTVTWYDAGILRVDAKPGKTGKTQITLKALDGTNTKKSYTLWVIPPRNY